MRTLHWRAGIGLGLVTVALGAGAAAPPGGLTLAEDGAWCWFGNPRALFHRGTLYFGYVRHRDGKACLNAFDPASGRSTLLWTSGFTQRDDHDNPGLLALADGRLLAIGARHGSDRHFFFRLSRNDRPVTPADWEAERLYTNTPAGVCYANPCQLADEDGRVFNFMRNLNFNPTVVTSDATATNWSAPTVLVQTGQGRTRPYVHYASDGRSRIDFIYTDGHPLVTENSLYHVFYQAGALHRSDGTVLKSWADLPLRHDAPFRERGTVIYAFQDTTPTSPHEHIRAGRAWNWDLVRDPQGHPVAVFSVQRDDPAGDQWREDRLFYYYARWTGSTWQKHCIAHAGRPLYEAERDYAGGITVDPSNPGVVYLSSNAAEPFRASVDGPIPLRAHDRYELYRGETRDGGRTFAWRPLTSSSPVDQLRPYVPRGNPYRVGVVWFAGTYSAYTLWSAEIRGLFRQTVP